MKSKTLVKVFLSILLTAGRLMAAEVHFAAFGDWGVEKPNNIPSQAAVAEQMTNFYGAGGKLDAVLLTGDNFYAALKDIHDRKWADQFEKMYPEIPFGKSFYFVLGNHDYSTTHPETGKTNKTIEIEYARRPETRWKFPATDPDTWYVVKFPESNPLVAVVALDSNGIGSTKWKKQRDWLEQQLKELTEARVPWLICMAHHPIYSNGKYYQPENTNDSPYKAMRADWLPLFKKYKVDFYLSGHDHNLQSLEVAAQPQTSFVISGAGGEDTYSQKFHIYPGMFLGRNGWAHFAFTSEKATVQFTEVIKGEPNASLRRYSIERLPQR